MKKYDRIIIWGAGQALQSLLDTINIRIDYIVDRDKSLWEKKIQGICVKSPEILQQEKGEILIIISAIACESEIRNDIRKMNISADVRNRCTLVNDSFSEYGEDIIVEKMFGKLNVKDILYLDIGIPSPIYGSNTYRFYINENKGCCIEANPDVIENLISFRPNDYVLNCGLGAVDEEGKELTYYRFKNREALNTFDKDIAEKRSKELGIELKDAISIEMKSLNSIIDK